MKDLREALKAKSSEERAMASRWFFKTGPGQYGEGDIFIGVSVPDIRTADPREAELTEFPRNFRHKRRRSEKR